MWKYIVPRIERSDRTPIVGTAIVGGLIGGLYGLIHDQITFSISAEYFTKVKFHQFRCVDVGFGDRVFASTIGFIATSLVGFVAGWVLARRLIPAQPRGTAWRQIRASFVCVFACGLLFGLLGYGYGLWRGPDAGYFAWDWAIQKYAIEDRWSFVRVAYIHNGGYLGGAIGLTIAILTIRPERHASS